ncbi:ankyrin repeat domain-containing protein [Legionella lytica]|uniref:Ankyrin repeat domain-containing protein n=1 Tax=Legionella lytica TaxID=96232 RepID=A0ABW8D6D5_9GAMM
MATLTHLDLYKLGTLLDYPLSDRGLCHGVALMAIQALLAVDEKSFFKRLDFIASYRSNFARLKEEIEEAKKKALSTIPPIEEATQKLLDILAFFDGIELYLVPQKHADLFDGVISQEDITTIYPLISSEKLKGTKLTHLFNRPFAFDKTNLKDYLNELANIFDDTTMFPPILLRNIDHSICLKYDKSDTWLYIDINDFGQQENTTYFRNLNREELADNIFKSFGPAPYPHVVMNVEVLTTKENYLLQSALEHLHAQHPITAEQAKMHDHLHTGLLFLACRHGNLGVVQELFQQPDALINTKTPNGETPLLIACAKGYLEIAQTLIAHRNTLVNESNLKKQSPLSFACAKKYTKIAQALLERRDTLVNEPNVIGETPLYIACEYECHDIVLLLIAREDILVDQGNMDGVTPLCLISFVGRVDIAETLLQKANINHPSYSGNTPFHYACASPDSPENPLMIQLLLNRGASLTMQNEEEQTALDIAFEWNNEIAISMLLEFTLENGLAPDKVMSLDTFETRAPWLAENYPAFTGRMSQVKPQLKGRELSFFNHTPVGSEFIYDNTHENNMEKR